MATRSPVRIEIIDPLTDSHWDEHLSDHPDHSVFHTAAWARVLHGAYGYKLFYLVAKEDDRVTGRFPLMEVNSWFTGRRGVALPFTDVCPPLYENTKIANQLLSHAVDLAERRYWQTLEWRGGFGIFRDATPALYYTGHTVRLEGDPDLMWRKLKSETRTAIRKAERSCVTIERGSSMDEMRGYYWLQCLTRRRHGLPPQPFRFFRKIHEHLFVSGTAMLMLARHHAEPIAGALFLRSGNKVVFKFGAANDRYQHLRANDLLMWSAIKHYAERGCDRMDLGRTSATHHGLRRFKRSLGAVESDIPYYRLDVPTNRFVRVKDQVDGWYNGLFRTMPEVAGRIVGAVCYKHMG